jgi:tetratricopeptide (TPR) repeat protein
VLRFIPFLLLFPFGLQAAEPDLLLITIDTLRADHLGSYGNKSIPTPNLDRIANQALFFENAFCTAPLTLPSHASILTVRYPDHHGTHYNAGKVRSEETTLAEILKKRGYHTYAFVGGFPLEHRFGLDQGFDVYDDAFPRDPGRALDFGTERNGEAVVEAFLKIPRKSPYFAWIHFYDPHAPYLNGGYAGEVAYVDKQIGRLMQNLNRENLIIAVAGDHGEGLGEHREETHRIFIYDSTMRVPFWIKAPGAKPERIASQVSLVDFLPTVLHLMNLPAPNNLDGKVLPESAGKTVFMESMFPQLQLGWSALRAVRTQEWKFIDAPSPELYDLKTDRGETKNSYSSRPDIVKRLKAMIPAKTDPQKTEAISPEMAEQLAALGYVGGSTHTEGPLPDPKQRIEVWNMIELAADLEKKDKSKAASLLEQARKKDPQNPMVLSFLAEIYTDQQQYESARALLEQILKRDPRNSPALLRLARLSLRTNKPQEALKWAEILRMTGEDYADTELLLANAYLKLGKKSEAATHLSKAVQLDPGDLASKIDLANLYMQLGRKQEAKDEFQRVLKNDSNNVQALNGLATFAFTAKQLKESEQYLLRALKNEPDDPQTKMNLALVYASTGRTSEAIALYREIQNSRNTPQEWRTLAGERLKELEP